jgi:hypothetical protein
MPEVMKMRGGAMRRRRSRTAGEDGRHEVAAEREERWRDERVHTVVDSMQTAGGHALLYRSRLQPELAELVEIEHRVLRQTELRQSVVPSQMLVEKAQVFFVFSASTGLVASHLRERGKETVTCGWRGVAIVRKRPR